MEVWTGRTGNIQTEQIVNQNCKPYHNCYFDVQQFQRLEFFADIFSVADVVVVAHFSLRVQLRLPNWKMLMLTHVVVARKIHIMYR